jgi:hypothetical protein
MTLNEIAYMILETIRANYISDDERIDIRLIKDWVHLKRAQYIKNQRTTNPNDRLNLNLYQPITLGVTVTALIDQGFYPYLSAVEDSSIVVSDNVIPSIIEDKHGPIIYSIESVDLMKLPFSIVDYDYMRVAGNGKFNTNLIFTSIRDNYVYFKYNTFFDTYDQIVIRAIFENPTEVSDFDDETSRYPANLGLIEYIKNAVFDIDLRIITSVKTDEENDADGKVE